MKTVRIIPTKHFESTVFGSFTRGEARDVPAQYAKHFVDADVAEYADKPEDAAGAPEQGASASDVPGPTEQTSDGADAPSGPENGPAPDNETPADSAPAAEEKKPRGGRKAKA